MLLKSNAGVVLRRLRRFEEELPQAVKAACAPSYWKPRLEQAAYKTLRAQWLGERSVAKHALYERMTPLIVATLMAEVFEGGVHYSLRLPANAPREGQFDLAGAVAYNLGTKTPTGRLKKFATHEEDQQQNLEAVRQTVRDWVQLEKNRDPARDSKADGTPLSDDEIAERILEILGVSDRAVPKARSPDMDAAAEVLSVAIERWLGGDGDTPPTTPSAAAPTAPRATTAVMEAAVVAQWFTAVLLAWRALLLASLADRTRREVEKLWKRIESELL